jgi:hypothetical protein
MKTNNLIEAGTPANVRPALAVEKRSYIAEFEAGKDGVRFHRFDCDDFGNAAMIAAHIGRRDGKRIISVKEVA